MQIILVILSKAISFFEKIVAIPKAIWLVAVGIIGLPILMSLAVTNEGSWADFATSVAVVAWLIGGVILTLVWLTAIDDHPMERSSGVKIAMVISIHVVSMLILAPIPLATAIMALEVGWLAGILTGSSLALLYWLTARKLFPKFKLWHSATLQEYVSS